jgi:hypothetical protein
MIIQVEAVAEHDARAGAPQRAIILPAGATVFERLADPVAILR